jgi:hypothetical protein
VETPLCYVNRALSATAVSEIHMLVPNLGYCVAVVVAIVVAVVVETAVAIAAAVPATAEANGSLASGRVRSSQDDVDLCGIVKSKWNQVQPQRARHRFFFFAKISFQLSL